MLYDEILDVHVSGHASQDEQKLLLNLLQPRYFVPIHGEYRHLVLHSKLAQQCGVNPENIFVMETGDVLEIDEDGAEVVDKVADSYVFIDGLGMGDVEQTVLEDRRLLSRNGFLVAIVNVDKYTGGLMGEPQMVTRGFVYEAETVSFLERARQEIERAVKSGGTRSEVAERLRSTLSRLAQAETGRAAYRSARRDTGVGVLAASRSGYN